jgi:hypothetical protein
MQGSDVTNLSVISLIITRGPQLPSQGVGLGGGGPALSHATDGKKKYHSEAKRFDW